MVLKEEDYNEDNGGDQDVELEEDSYWAEGYVSSETSGDDHDGGNDFAAHWQVQDMVTMLEPLFILNQGSMLGGR